MTLRLAGSTSGFTEIDAPAVAGSNTLVLPTGNGTADQALVTNGSGALSWATRNRMVLATAQNTTSGTNIDFTGIPSWACRVTMMFNGVSTNGTSLVRIQLGTSGGVETSGYNGASTRQASSSTQALNFTSGFDFGDGASAADVRHGSVAFALLGSNTWAAFGGYGFSNAAAYTAIGGIKALSGTLDRLRLTTVNGTDTFDAGSVNILYEG